jgi:hypothetical protein
LGVKTKNLFTNGEQNKARTNIGIKQARGRNIKTSERSDLTVAHQHRSATSLMVLLGSIAAILMYLMILGSRAYLPMPMEELEVERKRIVSHIKFVKQIAALINN